MQWNDSGYLRFCHGCYFVKDLGVFFLVLVVRITYGRYGFVYEVIKYGQHCLDGSRWDQWILGSEWYCGERWMRLMRHRQITWKYGSGELVLVTESQHVWFLQNWILEEIEYPERKGRYCYGCTCVLNNTQNSNYGLMWLLYYGFLSTWLCCLAQMKYVQARLKDGEIG